MGTFYDSFYDEAPLLCDNEAEVGNKLLEPAPEISSQSTVLTHADIDKLKVSDIKEEFKKCACSTKVVKAELNLRLKEAVENNMDLPANIADEVIYDLVGYEFALGAKWELEGVDDDNICIKEGLRNIGGT